jgi:hypothetical protein
MRVYALPAQEDWICDRMVSEFEAYNADISTSSPYHADILWLLSDWRWRHLPMALLRDKKVVTSIHHIVSEKFDWNAQVDFAARDEITNVYQVFNRHTLDFIRPLTKKPIVLVPYWANQHLWKPREISTEYATSLVIKFGLPSPRDHLFLGSFQRDTEGASCDSPNPKPKLEKGPDIFCDFVKALNECGQKHIHVLLAGWRRQYVINRLKTDNISFTYVERCDLETLRDLYQVLDFYAVTSRVEGGPQALIECGLMNVPVVSTPMGLADQVLPASAIASDFSARALLEVTPAIPNVDHILLPHGFEGFRDLFRGLVEGEFG